MCGQRVTALGHAATIVCLSQVLENARLVEFGAPGDLLAQGHDGPFSKLVDRTGPAVASHLRAIAQGQAALDFEALQLEKGGD